MLHMPGKPFLIVIQDYGYVCYPNSGSEQSALVWHDVNGADKYFFVLQSTVNKCYISFVMFFVYKVNATITCPLRV